MVVLYTIDLIFFIIRLSLLSNDLSKRRSDTTPFLVPILLFELIGSVPVILCNLMYVTVRPYFKLVLDNNHLCGSLWPLATMTCIRLSCHQDRPQAILLMRVTLLGCSFLLKFMCFVIGASCSARFNPECTAYTIFAAFALVAFILIIIVEFVHFFRLWRYNPTDTRNHGNNNQLRIADIDIFIEKPHRRQLGFIHYSLLNDQNAQGFRHSRCEEKTNCQSKSLHHYLLYHSLESEHNIQFETVDGKVVKPLIAFYQTTKTEALDIAQHGFPYGDNINPIYKDYLHLKQTIFFTRSCKQNHAASEAIICARLNLGRLQRIVDDENVNLNDYFGLGDGQYDTIYVEKTHRLYLRMPGQIENWIITIKSHVTVNDVLDESLYQSCI